jgi:preprotein translocase subunit SecG
MSLLIGFLTFVLVVNCLFLMLLVLVQLPKKEAGAGLAFGAGAVDTLIGAGSGNALTKMTKYAAGLFLCLGVLLAVLNAQRHHGSSRGIQQELSRKAGSIPALPTAPPAPANTGVLNTNPGAAPATSGTQPTPTLQLNPPVGTAPATNAPAAPDTKAQP